MLKPEEQLCIILKGVDTAIGEADLLAKLTESNETGRPLIVKLGLDPSAPDIHLGHTVVLRKMRQFQDLGHQAVIVIGDFTGKIGDPSGKSTKRTALTDEQVKENAKTYCEQIFKVLDPARTEVRFNSEWLSPLCFEEVLRLAATATVAQLLERDDFQTRYKGGTPISLYEFFYPLMQAYDSVVLKADVELGGTDQTFNVLMGRTMQKTMWQREDALLTKAVGAPTGDPQTRTGIGGLAQTVLLMPILIGLDDERKMSKSYGNYIGVNEAAHTMFKKVMEISDARILEFFSLVTDVHPDEIAALRARLEGGENPRDIKYQLARIVTGLYHPAEEVERAEVYYADAFQRGGTPADVPALLVHAPEVTLEGVFEALVAQGQFASKSELRRLLRQNGVQRNGVRIETAEQAALGSSVEDGTVLRFGQKKFIRIQLERSGQEGQHGA